jgi:ubiquinone/menaquinone biosynthesis C-methylase UbiE
MGTIMDIEKIKEQFNHTAAKYDNHRRCFIPCFDDFYTRSVSLLKLYKKDFMNVADLGAGTGLLTKAIYEMYPAASYTLIDISNDMLKIAKDRFAGMSNFNFLECNYVEDIPVNNCDLICSALSIHHLNENDKGNLYKNIYSKLSEGGCFINLDQFIAKSKKIDNLYNDWWHSYINNSGVNQGEKEAWHERRKLDKENTIDETIELLRKSGFENVECIYSFMKFGVVVAMK